MYIKSGVHLEPQAILTETARLAKTGSTNDAIWAADINEFLVMKLEPGSDQLKSTLEAVGRLAQSKSPEDKKLAGTLMQLLRERFYPDVKKVPKK